MVIVNKEEAVSTEGNANVIVTKQHRIAVIGTGTMGQRMITLMNEHPMFSVVALYDHSKVMLQKASQVALGAESYTSLAEMLEAADIDCAYIASPPDTHIEYMNRYFDRALPVFCEKPLSINVNEALDIISRAATEGIPAAINFPFASTPSLSQINKGIHEENLIGSINSIKIFIRFKTWPRPWQKEAIWLTYRKEGGFTREVLSHFLFATQRIVMADLKLIEKSIQYPDDPLLSETDVEALFMANSIPVHVSIGVGGDLDDDNSLIITGTNGALKMHNWYLADHLNNGMWEPLSIFL